MAQEDAKDYLTFVGGLVTEASPLAFPEGSSKEEENYELLRSGDREFRKGIDYEEGFIKSPVFNRTIIETLAIGSGLWHGVGKRRDISFLIVQIGITLYFHDVTASGAISAAVKAFTVDLTTFSSPVSSLSAGENPVHVESGLGLAIITSPYIDPFHIQYDENIDSITTTKIIINIRDLGGLDDGLAVDFNPPAPLSDSHQYNLRNQGWDSNKYATYFTAEGNYPSNAQIWFLGRDSLDVFDPAELVKQDFGTAQAPRGRFILDAMLDNKDAVSMLTGLDEVPVNTRPPASVFFNSKLWFVASDKVYFSQLIEDNFRNIGYCYQIGDPTSEHKNSITAADGGVINVPGMQQGTAIIASNDYIVVGAREGVWQIYAPEQDSVTATGYRLSKITDVGLLSHTNMVEVEGRILYASLGGIYILEPDRVTGLLSATNLTENTVQTKYQAIGQLGIENAKLIYDTSRKKVSMYYYAADEGDDREYKNIYDSILVFDVILGAFYIHKIKLLDGVSPVIGSAVVINLFKTELLTLTVTDNDGTEVVDEAGATVVIDKNVVVDTLDDVFVLALAEREDTDYQYTFARFTNDKFVDWEREDNAGIAYSGFLETGYDLLGTPMLKKTGLSITCYFKRTEKNIVTNADGDPDFDKPSGCKMQIKWDWTSSSSANKWTPLRKVYRLPRYNPPDKPDAAFDYGHDVIVSNTTIYGSGRALSVRFETESGKDCKLLGWSIHYNRHQIPK